MNYYETVYIIHPALQEGRLNDIVNKFQNKLEELKGKSLYVNNWGKKKLAYPIEKQKYGTYVLCQYSLSGENVKTISQDLELNPNILRYLTTKIDESKILEGSNKLQREEEIESNKTSGENNSSDIKEETIEPEKDKAITKKTKDDDDGGTSSLEEKIA